MSTATSASDVLPAGTWNLDPTHSTAAFAVRHNGISIFHGRFEEWDAVLEVDEHGDAALRGVVRPDSIAVRDETLAKHLRAPDFFDVERHPEVRFTSTEIRVGSGPIAVKGDLQIKDYTHSVIGQGSISDVVEDPFGQTRIALELETMIDRTDFGIDWNMDMPAGGAYLAREVALTLTVELVRA
jgi:polyisoprenoid-binding protein YceI